MTDDKSKDLTYMDAELVVIESIEAINRTSELLSEVVPYLKYTSDFQEDIQLKDQFRKLVVSIEVLAKNCVEIFDTISARKD